MSATARAPLVRAGPGVSAGTALPERDRALLPWLVQDDRRHGTSQTPFLGLQRPRYLLSASLCTASSTQACACATARKPPNVSLLGPPLP